MCKHLTYFPISSTVNDPNAIKAMYAAALRSSADSGNKDGVGIAYYGDNGPVVHKTGKSALIHTLGDEFVGALREVDLSATTIIGHVRSASTKFKAAGVATEFPQKDAHPFLVGNILLAHNGTITNHAGLVVSEDLKKGEIDSYALAEMLDAVLEDTLTLETLNSVTEKCNGSFALVLQDIRYPDAIYLCAHAKPLYIGVVNKEFGLITTSDILVDIALMETNETVRYLHGDFPWATWEFKKLGMDTWYLLDIQRFRKTAKLQELGKVKSRPAAVAAPYASGNYNSPAWHDHSAAAIRMAQMLQRLHARLPLAPEEIRYLYEELNDYQTTAKVPFNMSDTEALVEFMLYALTDDALRKDIESVFDITLLASTVVKDTWRIVRNRQQGEQVPSMEW